MKKMVLPVILTFILAFSLAGTGLAAPPGLLDKPDATNGRPQKLCPIDHCKIDPKIFVDYEGQRVYFCCDSCDVACVDTFKKDPEKYLREMAKSGISLEKVPLQNHASIK